MEHVFVHVTPAGTRTQLHKMERRRDSSYPENSISLTAERRGMPIRGHHGYDLVLAITRVERLTRRLDVR